MERKRACEQQHEEHDSYADGEPHDHVFCFGGRRFDCDQLIANHFALRQRCTVFLA